MFKLLATASVAALISTSAFADTISTLGSENSNIFSWGLPDTAAYGQTFTLSDAATLSSLSFRINDVGIATNYDLHIAAWGGTMVSGGSLFSVSGTTSGVSGMETVTNSLGDLMVGAGQYVAFFQATSANSDAEWGSISGSDPYAGGAFVFQNNGGDVSQWATSSWSTNWQGPGSDLAFELVTEVAAVPLPASLPLLLAGFGGLAAMRRRKKA